jgi:phospholipid-transporting ATPase
MKVSNVMKLMNKLLYSVFLFQLVLCLLFSVFFILWQNSNKDYITYLEKYNDNFEKIKLTANLGNLVTKFFTFYVAYSHLIPISLYVAMELVKLIQGMLINYDQYMIDPVTNIPAISRTSDLIEELGQVKFIFSDKTGTLTKNEMEFKKCYINNVIYGDDLAIGEIEKNEENENGRLENFNINGDKRAFHILQNQKSSEKNDQKYINDFFTIMAVCHSAYLDIKKDKIIFQVKYIKKLVFQSR